MQAATLSAGETARRYRRQSRTCSTGWPSTIALSSLSGRGVTTHTVDAGAVAVAYAVPEPAVTYTHRRDAGPVSVAYTVPPAEITYARGPRSFAVDADPVTVEYFVHIALVTHVSVAAPPIVRWLQAWSVCPGANIPRRWKIAEAQGRVMQRLVTAGGHAMREWWPLTARPAGLATWGRTVQRPAAYRRDWNGVPRACRQPKAGAGRNIGLGA